MGSNNSNLIGVRLGSVSDLQKHLLAWCTCLAAAQGVKVWNLNSSLQDGKALLAVLHGLDPFLWPYDPLVTAPPGKKFSELKVCVSTWMTCSRAFSQARYSSDLLVFTVFASGENALCLLNYNPTTSSKMPAFHVFFLPSMFRP